jgi:lipoprotein-anchoring transpeptidase ErfK/SrfK
MRRAIAVGAAAFGVTALAVSALLAPGLPAEGGTGMPAASAASEVVADVLPLNPKVALPPTPAAPLGPPPTLIATLKTAVSYSGAPGGAPTGSLPVANPFGGTQVVAVLGTSGSGPSEWLHVDLPIRPNGSTGWIRSSGVKLTQTSYHLAVSIAARSLTVTDAGRVVATTPVAVGTPSTPTPPGQTYLWELIRPDDPNGAYGPYIFGLGWFSDTYAIFNGGDAQIGIHGQDEPWSIGQAASHGCVRLPNDVITRLASLLPLGTPVTIS